MFQHEKALLCLLLLCVMFLSGFSPAYAYEPYDKVFLQNQIKQAHESLSLNQAKWRLIKGAQIQQYSQIDVSIISKLISKAKLTLTQAELALESVRLNYRSTTEQISRLMQLRDQYAERLLLQRDKSERYNRILKNIADQLQDLAQLEQSLAQNLSLSEKIVTADENYYKALQDIAEAKETLRQDRIREINIAHLKSLQHRWDEKAVELKKQILSMQTDVTASPLNKQIAEMRVLHAEEQRQLISIKVELLKYRPEISKLLAKPLDQKARYANAIQDKTHHLQHTMAKNLELIDSKIKLLRRYQNILSENMDEKMLDAKSFLRQSVVMQQQIDEYEALRADLKDIVKQLDLFNEKILASFAKLTVRQQLPESAREWKNLSLVLLDMPKMILNKLSTEFHQSILAIAAAQWYMHLLAVLAVSNCVGFCVAAFTMLRGTLSKELDKSANFTLRAVRFFAILLSRNSLSMLTLVLQCCLLINWLIYGQLITVLFALTCIWLVFKSMITVTRVVLLENVEDRHGKDARLFYALRWAFLISAFMTTVMIFAHQLALPSNVSHFIDRSFMLVLLAVSFPLLKSWDVLPEILWPYVSARPYLHKMVRMVGFLIPLTIFSNAALGLVGYVNLAWQIGVIEGQVILIVCAWVLARGLLNDLMQKTSEMLITKVANGWLWTQSLLKPLHRVMNFILLISAILFIITSFGFEPDSPFAHSLLTWFDSPFFQNASVHVSPKNIVQFFIMFAIVYWATKWSREFSYRWLFNQVKDTAVRDSLAVFTQYGTVVIGFFIMLNVLGIDLTTITVLAATLSIGIAFGIRDIFSNILSGLIMLIERPVRKGDYIQVNSYEGVVTNIGVRAITVRMSDNKEVILPNNEAIVKTFVNWTHKDSIIRDHFRLKVAFHDNPAIIRSSLVQQMNTHPLVLDKPAPSVLLQEIVDDGLSFEVRFYLDMRTIRSRADARSEVMLSLMARLKAEGIQLPYPVQTVHVKNRAALEPIVNTNRVEELQA